MNEKNIFSVRLKELRLSKNLSQTAFGEIIGIKPQGVNDMEHGRSKISFDRLVLLCRSFNISADYLLGLSESRERLP